MLNHELVTANPYPYYAEKREKSPIFQDKQGTWHLTRYQDVVLMLSDERFCRQPFSSQGYVNQNNSATLIDNIINKWSLFNNPPEHTRLREMLGHLINPRFIKNTRVTIESIVDKLIANFAKSSQIDFMQAFAYPLPVQVINHLLGASLEVATVRQWSFAFATAMDHGSMEELIAVTPIVTSMFEALRELVLEREKNLGDDWVSELIKLKSQYQLSIDDIVSNCIFIMLAAHETLQLSLGLGIHTLLNHPEQLQLLQSNLNLIPSAVEELLRFDAPWNKMSRWTKEEVVISGVVIPKNQLVVSLINSANRDASRFPHPDTFDITRTNNRHLAFGHGIHLCHGALLARLELQITFTKLAPILSHISLIKDEIEWSDNTSLRYIKKLMLRINHHD